jgi:hypothetical protein
LVSARRFKDLGAGTGEEIGAAEMIDRAPRQLSLTGIAAEENGADPAAKEAAASRASELPRSAPAVDE